GRGVLDDDGNGDVLREGRGRGHGGEDCGTRERREGATGKNRSYNAHQYSPLDASRPPSGSCCRKRTTRSFIDKKHFLGDAIPASTTWQAGNFPQKLRCLQTLLSIASVLPSGRDRALGPEDLMRVHDTLLQ